MKSIGQIKKCLLVLIVSLVVNEFSMAANLQIEYTKSDVTCFGQSNGQIELVVNGGKKPYNVKWSDGAEGFERSNLKNGTYNAIVTDASGKIIEEKIEILMPNPLSIAYNAPGETVVDAFNGSIDSKISGGSPWSLDNGNNFYFVRLNGKSYYENMDELENGVYTLGIEDSKGCSFDVKVNLTIEKGDEFSFGRTEEEINKEYNGYGDVKLTLYQTIKSKTYAMN